MNGPRGDELQDFNIFYFLLWEIFIKDFCF